LTKFAENRRSFNENRKSRSIVLIYVKYTCQIISNI